MYLNTKYPLSLLFILCCFFFSEIKSQNHADSAKKEEPKIKEYKFIFGFDSRISWVLDTRTRFNGIKIGIEYRGKDRVGLGIYSVKNPIIIKDVPTIVDSTPVFNGFDTVLVPVLDTLNYLTHYSYTTLFLDHIFISKKKWEISMPLQLGAGTATIDYTNPVTSKRVEVVRFGFLVTEISVAGHYKFFPWLGIGTGVGYRSMLTKDKQVKKAFDAPIFVFKLKIFLGDLYRGIFPKKEK
ncbi:MAG: hypothetical protein HUU48_08805 [Flavobacteriales bacterium]|nr:hypothetical protein [Flavobacteriales bacterium]